MKIQDICTPGLIVSQLFPNARKSKGVYISALQQAAKLNFYGAFEIAEVIDPSERKEIRSFIKNEGLKLVYWLSFIQYDSGISISAIDENERLKAVGQLIEQIPKAFECGADFIGFLSGPDVRIERRDFAKKQLKKSICEMADTAKSIGQIDFLMEPLDRNAHKKHIIGPTNEAATFIYQLREWVPEMYLVYDVAHIKLLGEDPLESFSVAINVMSEIHLANCVDDPKSTLFGDNHMPIGEPGFLTSKYITDLFNKGFALGFLGPSKPIVSPEVLCRSDEDPWLIEKNGRENLSNAVINFLDSL